VTGHSLGGALAQLAAASYGDMIQDSITFQSPGLNAEEASTAEPPVDYDAPTSTFSSWSFRCGRPK
jgi:putative lipase involved disintegration of autophagic bodies